MEGLNGVVAKMVVNKESEDMQPGASGNE